MSDIWIPYGGGADLDVVTAEASDVRTGKVIVDKDGNPLTGIMAEIAAKTYTPGTSNQVIAANQFLAGAQTIKGDGNLNANNIVYGKSIFGVSGNVRKYASITKSLTSSTGTRTFRGLNANDPSLSLNYVILSNTGFTPLYVSLVGDYATSRAVHVACDGWGVCYAYRTSNSYANCYIYWFKKENISSNSIILPVPEGGKNFTVQIFGYY